MRYKLLLRSEENLAALEEALVDNCGDMSASAQTVDASPAAIHFWMEDDPAAAQRLRLAQQIGWSRLESAAYQRAVVGVQEDVYFKGEVVGQKTVYSDGLLSQMLKARNTAYAAQPESQGPRMVVNIMPRAESYEEWVGMRVQALKQLAAPVAQVEYTDYEPITSSALRDVL